ncbi:MAG TPA: glycosyl hydrolase family 8 [Silvibacterium sp.]|nr:glycosyl hydrolase family 8 [Silvibacterium sp.]
MVSSWFRAWFRALIVCALVFVLIGAASAQAGKPSQQSAAASAPPPPHQNAPLPEIPSAPGDGDGAYRTGNYRDLFAKLGHTQAESKAKIERAFQQLFHGDGQEERIYFETGANANGPLAYITDWANNDARTEGMSYGMMIAVQLDKKREFDAIWNWANTYMLITDPKNPSVGYFAWSMNTDGTPRSIGAAPDGEEYFAMALYFAANRWGNGKGIYNYQAEADRILRAMRHHAVLTGTSPFRIHPDDPPFIPPDQPWPSPNNRARERELAAQGKSPTAFFHMPSGLYNETIGPMVEENYYMVRFVPNEGDGFTDASYHLPAFYELWSRWGPVEDRAFWARAADVSREMFTRVTGPLTGLTPDRNNFDMTQIIGRDGVPTPFGYDSWRSVSNWSVDYSWWRKDPREAGLSDRIQLFLSGQGIKTFADRYTLDGKPLSTRHSIGMVATTAVGSLSATPGPVSKAFLEELWNASIPSGEQRYYDGMLYLMSLMHCSGNFQIIMPR